MWVEKSLVNSIKKAYWYSDLPADIRKNFKNGFLAKIRFTDSQDGCY